MAFATIPTRTTTDPNSSADINQLMDNDTYLYANIGGGGLNPIVLTLRGNIVVADDQIFIDLPFDCTMGAIGLKVGTASTGADMTVDILKNGTSFFASGYDTISAGNTTGTKTADTGTSCSKADRITIDIKTVGSTVQGADLSITLNVS